MDQKECDAAADALCAWFVSQQIDHRDGAMVIARVMSSMLVTEAKTHADLVQKVRAFNDMMILACENTYLIKVMGDKK